MQREEMIAQFAKANKISKAKLTEFAAAIGTVKKEKPAKPKGVTGRPLSEDAVAIRDLIATKTGQEFTSRDIADHLGGNVTTVMVNNSLFSMQRRGQVNIVGKVGPTSIWRLA